ncbi:MAG: NADP-dependent phosphogluconate dehydrogenase [Bacteroidota bacterium]
MDFGIIGLGVMGRSLAKNIAGKGFSLSVYNRMTEAEKEVVPNFLKNIHNKTVQGYTEMEGFVLSLSQPRKILLMVNAGSPVDAVIAQLKPLLAQGDIIIDGGNSHYKDTQRRATFLKEVGLHFIGCGISGGEQGALSGPSMMAGGAMAAYAHIEPVLKGIAAKDNQENPCVNLLGSDGCGHFVKTIHNGIEYAEMQLLAECYALLAPTYSYEKIASIFEDWNTGPLASYLLEITAQIMTKKEGDSYLLDKVLDQAGSKGTGSWSSQAAFQLGVPASMINAAVTARYISALKEQRVKWSGKTVVPVEADAIDIDLLKDAYTFARILNHYQGFEIIKAASKENQWNVNFSEIARIWTKGCIIQSQFMESLVTRFRDTDDLLNDTALFSELQKNEKAARSIIKHSLNLRIPIPCISNSLQSWMSLTTERSSAHLIQAQRDEFGAHTYKRIDKPFDQTFTSNWTHNG